MKTVKMLALAGACAVAMAAPATADTITYDLTGSFTGVNGGPFRDVSAVFTGIGNTDDAFSFGDNVTVVPLSSFTALAGGLTYTFTTPISYFVNRQFNLSGFISSDIERGFIRFNSTSGAGFANYDGTSNLAPTALDFYTDGATSAFVTDRGDVLVTSASNLVLTASTAGAVPEPATWAMMIGGMGVVGGAMRRRRSVSTKVSFA
jgi:hypothetical protein